MPCLGCYAKTSLGEKEQQRQEKGMVIVRGHNRWFYMSFRTFCLLVMAPQFSLHCENKLQAFAEWKRACHFPVIYLSEFLETMDIDMNKLNKYIY